MHTESTLLDLEACITRYGKLIRQFHNRTCHALETYETPREFTLRTRRLARQAAKAAAPGPTTATGIIPLPPTGPALSKKRKKTYTFKRYKLHALGDTPTTIRIFGTTENYSTLRVSSLRFASETSECSPCSSPFQSELEHRNVKNRYRRTNKTRTATNQIAIMEVINRRLQSINRAVNRILKTEEKLKKRAHRARSTVKCRPAESYSMAKEPRHKIGISRFLQEHNGDPAVNVSEQYYLLSNRAYSPEITLDLLDSYSGIASGTSSLVSFGTNGMKAKKRRTRIKSASGLKSRATSSSNTPISNSTIRRTMYDGAKTLSVSERPKKTDPRALDAMSWSLRAIQTAPTLSGLLTSSAYTTSLHERSGTAS